ncbi:MAG: cytochrome c5 family protein [Betaproteobacteria bacterium]|nr:cytochrome c5 family protein [Betaproteobacteria bacterium]
MSEEHENFIKTPKQLVIIVVLAFVLPIMFIVLLSQLMTGDKKLRPDEQPVAIADRIKPVGDLVVAGPKVLLTGDKVYETICQTCHAAGLAGAHKLGDKAAWAKVVAQGQALSVTHAIAGIRGMPARGGNADLTDEEVAGAVVFMANQAGATWKAPELKMPAAAPAQARGTAAAAAPAAAAPAMPAATPAPAAAPAAAAAPTQASAAGGKGKATYDTTCMVCHATGVAGAPKFGDKAAWAPRIQTGAEALYNSSLKGKNAMPPKGGNPGIADADVKAAVDYMMAAAK